MDAGLSMARHVNACDRHVSELCGEMLREERAGVMCYWHVQSTLKLLGMILENSKTCL